MNMENTFNNLPEEVILPQEELLTDEQGKKYKYEKDGVKYGGDFLEELPDEISIEELPKPPTEENSVI